ncbi:MAG: hypothetical protein M3680_10530 [Myxococcota bacterium]|nr:hypothetical protein [Myxococcota bacterium]
MQSCSPILLATLVACGGAAPPVSGPVQPFETERVHTAGQVRLWVPDGWAVEDTAPDALILTAPDRGVSLSVSVLDGQDLGSALLGVATSALVGFDDLQLVGTPVDMKINGMAALFQDGRGTYRGQQVELSVGVIDTPADKYLLVIGEAEPGLLPRHEATLRQFMDGIKPL